MAELDREDRTPAHGAFSVTMTVHGISLITHGLQRKNIRENEGKCFLLSQGLF